jgi:hypothetical protein
MKAYLANLLPRLQQFSQTLDRKEILIDQPWVLVDDDMNKAQYIFRREGSLIMSFNGNAVTGRWEYISAAKSLLIDIAEKKTLLNHGFVEKGVLILKKDGFQATPWIMVNERIVPDLDVEKYLDNLLRTKFHIRYEEMESGINLEFSDPNSNGLQLGTEVTINGVRAVDGVYKASGKSLSYEVRNGKVISIFVNRSYETDKGIIIVREPAFYDDYPPMKVFLNGAVAPNGKYQVKKGGIKYFIIENGVVKKLRRKLSVWFILFSVLFLSLIALMIYLMVSKKA